VLAVGVAMRRSGGRRPARDERDVEAAGGADGGPRVDTDFTRIISHSG